MKKAILNIATITVSIIVVFMLVISISVNVKKSSNITSNILNETINISNNFSVISHEIVSLDEKLEKSMEVYTMVDKTSENMYIVVVYNGDISITPLYNKDGTIKKKSAN